MPDDLLTESRARPRPRPDESAALGAGVLLPDFASAAAPRRRVVWPFVLMVVLPTLIGVVYFNWIAARQYVTTAVFALRMGEESDDGGRSGASSLAAALGPGGSGAPTAQSYGIASYIESLPAIEDIVRAGVDVRAMLSSPLADALVRLPAGASQEALLRSWRGKVDAQFEVTRGVITVRTRAFTAEDSLALAEAILKASERMVNGISARMHADALQYAEEQVRTAEHRLSSVRAALKAFRTATGVVNAGRASTSSSEMEGRLRQELVTAEAQAESLRASAGQGSPMHAAATARARVLRQQIMDAERQVSRTGSDREGSTWAAVLERHEALTSELELADRFVGQTRDLLHQARTTAVRQRTYLLTFVRPVEASEALYPNGWLSPLVVFVCAFFVWAVSTLLFHAIRDHA